MLHVAAYENLIVGQVALESMTRGLVFISDTCGWSQEYNPPPGHDSNAFLDAHNLYQCT